MRNTKENKRIFKLKALKTLVCVLALGLFVSSPAFAPASNKNQKLNSIYEHGFNSNMEGSTCKDCAYTQLPLPMLPADIRGLPMLLGAIAPAVVFGEMENGTFKDPREPVTSPTYVPGVGRFIGYNGETKSYEAAATGFLINECLVMTNRHIAQEHDFTTINVHHKV